VRWLLALVLWAGCYAPHPSAGAPCADGVCPEGLVCSPATQTCERTAADASTHDGALMRDAAMIDARPDAPRDATIIPDAAAGPMLVQEAIGYTAMGSTASATLPAMPVTGHLLVVIGGCTSGGITVSGGGATWTVATSSLTNSNEEIYFGVTNGTSATVTITLANANAPVFLWVGEWSGAQVVNILDKARSTSGSTSPASAGSIAPTNAKDLVLFAASAYAPNTFGTPSPETWTPLTGISQTAITQREWYLVQSAAMSHAPAVPLDNPGAGWDAAIATFRLQ